MYIYLSGRNYKIEYHHIFPKSLLQGKGYERKEINEIANLAFLGGKTNKQILNKETLKYFNEIVLPKHGKEVLESQLIPLDENLWKIENYRKFLSFRRKKIIDLINKYMKKFL